MSVAALTWAVSVALAVPTPVLLVAGASQSTPADSFGLADFGGLAFLVAAIALATTGRLLATRTTCEEWSSGLEQADAEALLAAICVPVRS